MSVDAARLFIKSAESDASIVNQVLCLKGDASSVASEIATLAKAYGHTFSEADWDVAIREFIFDKVKNNQVTPEQYQQAAKYIAGTGSVICCCSFWSRTT